MIEKIKYKIYKFLRWSEKWTQTDMVYLSRGGFWLIAGHIVSVLSGLLLSIAFANLLPVETYGVYKYILSLIGLLSIPTLAGVTTALTQAVAKNFEGTLMPAIKVRIKWGLLGGLASLILSGYYYFNGNYALTISFLITGVFLPFMDPLNTYVSYLSGKKLFKTATKYNLITQTAIALITISVLYLTNNLFLIIFTYFASRTLINSILLKFTLIKYKPNDQTSDEAIAYGKHLTLMNIIALVAAQLDKILVWHYLGAAQLAVYAFALAPIDQINGGILKNLATLAFPKLADSDSETIKKTFPGKINKFLLIMTAGAIVYIVLAPFLYKIFFPQYLASVIYSQFMAITIAILPLSLYNTALTAQAQKKKLYFLSYTVSIIKIMLLFILLPLFGVAGVIGAILGANLYGNFSTIYLFKKM